MHECCAEPLHNGTAFKNFKYDKETGEQGKRRRNNIEEIGH